MSEATDLATQNLVDTDALRSLTTVEEAIALHEQSYRAEEVLGDGFQAVDDKDELVKVPFYIVQFKEITGDYGSFVMVWIMTTNDNRKLRFSDGSTGVKEQLLRFREQTGQSGGLAVPSGLVRSDYENEHGPATTYYLSES